MSLSVFFVLIGINSNSFFIKIFCLILSLGTYQSAISIFFILNIIECVQFKNILLCVKNLIGGLLSLILYKFLISSFFISSSYGQNRSEFIDIFNFEGISTLVVNVDKYFNIYFWHYHNYSWIILIILLISSIIYLFKIKSNIVLFCVFSVSVVAGLCSVLMYCFLVRIVVMPRAYLWTGAVNVLLVYVLFYVYAYCRNVCCMRKNTYFLVIKNTLYFIIFLISFYSFNVMSTYVHASRFLDKHLNNILMAISVQCVESNIVYLKGWEGLGPVASRAVKVHPFLREVLFPPLTQYFNNYAVAKGFYVNLKKYSPDLVIDCNNKILTWNNTYDLHFVDGVYVVNFERNSCKIQK